MERVAVTQREVNRYIQRLECQLRPVRLSTWTDAAVGIAVALIIVVFLALPERLTERLV